MQDQAHSSLPDVAGRRALTATSTSQAVVPAPTPTSLAWRALVCALSATLSLLVWLFRTILLNLCFCSPWAPPLAVWAVVAGLDPSLVWNNAQQQQQRGESPLAASQQLSLVIAFGVLGSASLLAGNCLAQHHPWEGPISTACYPDHPNTRPRKTVLRIYTWSCFSLATTFFAATIAVLARSKKQLPASPDPLTPESASTAEQTTSVDLISQIQALEATIARLSEPSALIILLYAFGCTTFGALWADFTNPRLRTLESTLASFSQFRSRAEAASVSAALALPRSLVSKLHHWQEASAHGSDHQEIARVEKYTGHVSYHHERVEVFKQEPGQLRLAEDHRETYELEQPTAWGVDDGKPKCRNDGKHSEQTESWIEAYRRVYFEEERESTTYEGYRLESPTPSEGPPEQEHRLAPENQLHHGEARSHENFELKLHLLAARDQEEPRQLSRRPCLRRAHRRAKIEQEDHDEPSNHQKGSWEPERRAPRVAADDEEEPHNLQECSDQLHTDKEKELSQSSDKKAHRRVEQSLESPTRPYDDPPRAEKPSPFWFIRERQRQGTSPVTPYGAEHFHSVFSQDMGVTRRSRTSVPSDIDRKKLASVERTLHQMNRPVPCKDYPLEMKTYAMELLAREEATVKDLCDVYFSRPNEGNDFADQLDRARPEISRQQEQLSAQIKQEYACLLERDMNRPRPPPEPWAIS